MAKPQETQLHPQEAPSTLPWFQNKILLMLERMPGIFTIEDQSKEHTLVTEKDGPEELEISGVLVGDGKANQPIDFTLDAQAVCFEVRQWTEPVATLAGRQGAMVSLRRYLKLTKEVHASGYKLIFRHISHAPRHFPGPRV